MKAFQFLFFVVSVSTLLIACSTSGDLDDVELSSVDSADFQDTVSGAMDDNSSGHSQIGDSLYDESSACLITFGNGTISVNGDGASVSSNRVTVSNSGTYILSGEHSNAQVLVNSEVSGAVKLVFRDLVLANSSSAPIYIKAAEKTVIILDPNTENTLTDAQSYSFDGDDDEPKATVFCKKDLSIEGSGTLTITGNYNDGINCKQGVFINAATLKIKAVDDGIRGKDYVILQLANVSIVAGGDGIKSDNDDDSGLGYILIESGIYSLTSTNDGMQACTDLLISDGTFSITSGGGSNSGVYGDVSAKALKSTVNLIVDGGTFTLNAADDAIHTNGKMTLNSGDFLISTADDGAHADAELVLDGSNLTITKCYEGIEAENIILNSGNAWITASDDGINAVNGESEMGGPGGPGAMSSGSCTLTINGGYVYMNANGDGLDCNGSVTMKGGTILVDGPTSNGNGPLDYDGSFSISGGYLAAVGSSGMAQAPGSSSSQNSLLLAFTSAENAGTLVHIEDGEGNNVITFSPKKQFQSLSFSSNELEMGQTYNIYLGGTSTGEIADGLITGGFYSGGTLYKTFTITSVVTSIGKSSGGPHGGPVAP
jgi:hypothetical protein